MSPAVRLPDLAGNILGQLPALKPLQDAHGEDVALHYVRDREKREVDFLTVRDRKPELLVEAKLSETALSPSLRYYAEKLRPAQASGGARRPPGYAAWALPRGAWGRVACGAGELRVQIGHGD